MNSVFTPAKKDKISTLIIRQIRLAILQGKLKPGEALPPENVLVEQFGVSRHTLREALRALEGMGFITIRRGAGGGPRVCEIDWETARESFAGFLHFHDFSVHDISEVRKLLEPHMARRAAENFTPEDLAELEAVHEECEAIYRQNRPLVGAEAEIMFHVLLGKLTGNPVLWVILDFVNNLLADAKTKVELGADFALQVLEAHRKILQAIRDHDPEEAARSMLAHVSEVDDGLARLAPKNKQA